MVHPILAGDVVNDRHRELLHEAQHQHLIRRLTCNRRSWAASLRVSAQTVLVALGIRAVPERGPAIQPPVSCACYID
jgi:hypothetical protein